MAARRWLLIPMQPTPNGRLHLGHGAGPYLRADVIARAPRRDGDDVQIITGTDAHENWVLADGLTSGHTPSRPAPTSTPASPPTWPTPDRQRHLPADRPEEPGLLLLGGDHRPAAPPARVRRSGDQ